MDFLTQRTPTALLFCGLLLGACGTSERSTPTSTPAAITPPVDVSDTPPSDTPSVTDSPDVSPTPTAVCSPTPYAAWTQPDCTAELRSLGSLACAWDVVQGEDSGGGQGGYLYAPGDVDGDGSADLMMAAVLAAPGAIPAAGSLRLSLGPFAEHSARGVQTVSFSGIEPYGNLGRSAAIGDLDGDGRSDLVTGAMYANKVTPDNGDGVVYVVYDVLASLDLCALDSAEPILPLSPDGRHATVTLAQQGQGGGLGGFTALSDLDADGYDDLLVAAPWTELGSDVFAAGRVYLFYGSGTRWSTLTTASADATFESGGYGDNLGLPIKLLDLDAPGSSAQPMPEVLLGALGRNEGQVLVFSVPRNEDGTPRRFSGRYSAEHAQLVLIGWEPGSMFGWDFLQRPTGSTSPPNLMVAAPNVGVDANYTSGEVYVLEGEQIANLLQAGRTSGTQQLVATDSIQVYRSSSGLKFFGRALALVEDFDGDGAREVLIGTEENPMAPDLEAGCAFLFSGLDDSPRLFPEDAAFTWRAQATHQKAGASLTSLDGFSGTLIGATGWDASGCTDCGIVYFVTPPPGL